MTALTHKKVPSHLNYLKMQHEYFSELTEALDDLEASEHQKNCLEKIKQKNQHFISGKITETNYIERRQGLDDIIEAENYY